MNLTRYIKGNRKGSDINQLERRAMNDLFLADALEGYDRAPESNHAAQITRLSAELRRRRGSQRRKNHKILPAAGGILLLAGILIFLIVNKKTPQDNQILPVEEPQIFTDSVVVAPLPDSAETIVREKKFVKEKTYTDTFVLMQPVEPELPAFSPEVIEIPQSAKIAVPEQWAVTKSADSAKNNAQRSIDTTTELFEKHSIEVREALDDNRRTESDTIF